MSELDPAATGEPQAERPLTIDVRRGSPTDEELAALLAVVSEAYASEAASALADDASTPSAWTRTQRRLRRPLPRGIAFGRFTG